MKTPSETEPAPSKGLCYQPGAGAIGSEAKSLCRANLSGPHGVESWVTNCHSRRDESLDTAVGLGGRRLLAHCPSPRPPRTHRLLVLSCDRGCAGGVWAASGRAAFHNPSSFKEPRSLGSPVRDVSTAFCVEVSRSQIFANHPASPCSCLRMQ